MRTRLLVALAVLVALGGGIGLGAALFGGDDDGDDVSTDGTTGTTTDGGDDDGSTTTSGVAQGPTTPATLDDLPATTVPEAGLSGPALEAAQAINRAHQLTYHILLRSVDPESPNETELWRRLPLARRDARLGEGEQVLETREFRTADGGHIGCLIDNSGMAQTTCLEAPPGQLDPADPILGVLDPSAGPITASTETVGGVSVRCFTQTQEGVDHVACFDADGIPAVIDGGNGRLERVGEPDRGIADDVFVPPEASFIPSDTTGGNDEEESNP